jgi:hypothetical protein
MFPKSRLTFTTLQCIASMVPITASYTHSHTQNIYIYIYIYSAYYCDVLRHLLENLRRLRPELRRQNDWLLHHDKALSHDSFFTREFLTKNNMTVVPHPPRSPDLVPCVFSVSPIEDKTERPPF